MKKLILALGVALMSLSTVELPAFFDFGDVCCEDGPLNCGAFGVQVKGGVTPAHFTHKGRFLIINPSVLPAVSFGDQRASFDKVFDTPWQVGAELEWNASTHVQFFAEYAYTQASGKSKDFLISGLPLTVSHRDFETNAFYMGARYFFSSIWSDQCGGNNICPFFGFKGGWVWNAKDRSHFTINGVDIGSFDHFKDQGAVSAGLQIGLDWAINCNFGVVFTAEAVATQGLRGNRIFDLPDTGIIGGPTNIGTPETGKLISYPVTLGVRYTF